VEAAGQQLFLSYPKGRHSVIFCLASAGREINAVYYLRQGGYVRFYLSVGLSAGLHKKLQADLTEIFREV